MTARELAQAIGARLVGERTEMEITGAAVDSRSVGPGELFWSLPGARTDGGLFWREAMAQGAAGAVLSHQPADWPLDRSLLVVPDRLAALERAGAYARQRFLPRVVAVTGSVGKTTAKEFIAAVLAKRFRVSKTVGNQNTEIGLPLNLLRLDETVEVLVVEMGMRGLGEIAHLTEIARPDIGVITNLGLNHLERLGSVERIVEAKGELLRGLPPGGVGILNGDDRRLHRLGQSLPGTRLYTGLGSDNDVRAIEPRWGPTGTVFELWTTSGQATVHLPIPGRPALEAALLATGVGITLGLSVADLAAGLATLPPSLSRSVIRPAGDWLIIDDTYNAAPASMRAALELLELLGRGRRRVAVLGEMLELGDMAPISHREVGRQAAAVVDLLLAVGPLGEHLATGARKAGLVADHVLEVADAATAMSVLAGRLQAGDLILVKASRAVQLEQVVRGLLSLAGAELL